MQVQLGAVTGSSRQLPSCLRHPGGGTAEAPSVPYSLCDFKAWGLSEVRGGKFLLLQRFKKTWPHSEAASLPTPPSRTLFLGQGRALQQLAARRAWCPGQSFRLAAALATELLFVD